MLDKKRWEHSFVKTARHQEAILLLWICSWKTLAKQRLLINLFGPFAFAVLYLFARSNTFESYPPATRRHNIRFLVTLYT